MKRISALTPLTALLMALNAASFSVPSRKTFLHHRPNNNYHGSTTSIQASTESSSSPSSSSSPPSSFEYALIFDCDGVIIETEELHRQAYNAAFRAFHLEIEGEPVEWSVEYYDVLQNTVGGGKNKMWFHFRDTCNGTFPSRDGSAPPTTEEERGEMIDALQESKTELYKQLVEESAVPRPGVLELMDEALSDPTVAVGVCSASTKAAASKVLDATLGPDRRSRLNVCILGDDVSKLKPDPMIYAEAARRLGGIDPRRCVVVEDSSIGLRAAKGAGMRCLVTYTDSTVGEDFYGLGADAKVPDLGSVGVTLETIFGPLRKDGLDAEILKGLKDDA